jgi:hypothetical protein
MSSSTVLCEVVELLAILIDNVDPLLYVEELLQLVVHEACQNVMPMKGSAEHTAWNLMVVLECGGM